MVKNLPAMQETQIQPVGQEDPCEKEMATHSSILAWRTPRTEEPGRLLFMGSQRVRHDRVAGTPTFSSGLVLGVGNDESHVCECVKSLSCVQLFATLWAVARQAPLSMGFSHLT